jgi:hypothetical protein
MSTVRPPARPWKQAIYLWVGIALVPIGIIIAPLPGPGGIPILAVAALLIITSSRRAASWVRLHRRRWDWMNEILLKGEGWLGGEMGRALRRTNGRRNLIVAKPPASRRERILDILLFPVHVAIIVTRALAGRFGWRLPGDARKERKAERERRRLHRARRRRRRRRDVASGGRGGRGGKGRKAVTEEGSKATSTAEETVAPDQDRPARRRRKNREPVSASMEGGA